MKVRKKKERERKRERVTISGTDYLILQQIGMKRGIS
jgi:hypothetical protein